MPSMLGKDGMDARDTGYAMDIIWYGWVWML